MNYDDVQQRIQIIQLGGIIIRASYEKISRKGGVVLTGHKYSAL